MLYYNDEAHSYWWEDENGKVPLTSVTQTISKAKKPFDKYAVSANMKSVRSGERTAKDVLAEWKLKGDVACDWGNAIHKAVECWVRYKVEPKNHYLRTVIEAYKKLGYENDRAEMLVYDIDLGIAGRMDLIDGYDVINIRDIKTSWEIEKPQKKFKGVLADKILSKLDEYTLQLSIYAYIMERKGRNVGELTILEWNGLDGNFEPINVPYKPDWVEILLNQY